jgi:hypothetical protein
MLNLPVRTVGGFPVFDCRVLDDAPRVKAPWGETLYGVELAAYSLGISEGWAGNACYPISVSGYRDTRGDDEKFMAIARDLAKHAKRLRSAYEKSVGSVNNGRGGSVNHAPVAVAVTNFGGSVIADRRVFSVEYFRED